VGALAQTAIHLFLHFLLLKRRFVDFSWKTTLAFSFQKKNVLIHTLPVNLIVV